MIQNTNEKIGMNPSNNGPSHNKFDTHVWGKWNLTIGNKPVKACGPD